MSFFPQRQQHQEDIERIKTAATTTQFQNVSNSSICTTRIDSESVTQDQRLQRFEEEPYQQAVGGDKTTPVGEKDIESGRDQEKQEGTQQQEEKKKMSILDNTIFCGFLLILAGFAIAFQAGCNATLNRYGGRSFSSVVSFGIGMVCCLIFFALDVGVAKTPLPNDLVKSAPWYAWLGGILGAYYVVVNILTVPRLGTATVLSTFVCAQIIMACIIDHFALVGVNQRPYTVWRILGSLGLVGSVVVIALF